MTRFTIRVLVPLLALAVAATLPLSSLSCTRPYDRQGMLRAIVGAVVLPGYEEAAARAVDLHAAVERLCGAPDPAALDAAQAAWDRARGAWKATDVSAFGPYREEPLRIGPKVDFWPARPDTIELQIAASNPIDSAWIESLGAPAKGLPAIEYLLFEPAGGDAAVLSRLTTTSRRCVYLRAIAQDAVQRTEEIVAAWDPARGNFTHEVVDGGAGSNVFSTLRDAVNEVFNRMVFTLEDIRELKLGAPAGKKSGGVPQPDQVESRFSDRSLEDILDNLRGVENVYRAGFQDYLLNRRAQLEPMVLPLIDEARAAVRAIPAPLRTAVAQSPAEVETAYQAVKRLHRLLAVDVANAIGATLTFNDTDGD